MQRLFTIILTSSVLAHAAFGCCLHHAHSCEADCCDTPSVRAESCSCECEGHEEHGDFAGLASLGQSTESDGESSHQSRHQCEGDNCSFARTESSPDNDSMNAGDFTAVPVLPTTLVEQMAGNSIRAASFQPGAGAVTSRRYLILAVLLI